MKALLLVTLVSLSSCTMAYSQLLGGAMVVNDPKANAALMKQITQGVKSVEQATKTVKLLKETKEMYDDINSALQTLDYVTDMSKLTKQILQNSGQSLKDIQATGLFNSAEMGTISNRYSALMNNGNTIINVANDLLSGGIFKMNDAERIQLLREYKQDLELTLMDTRLAKEHYMHIAEKRALKNYFTNQSKPK